MATSKPVKRLTVKDGPIPADARVELDLPNQRYIVWPSDGGDPYAVPMGSEAR